MAYSSPAVGSRSLMSRAGPVEANPSTVVPVVVTTVRVRGCGSDRMSNQRCARDDTERLANTSSWSRPRYASCQDRRCTVAIAWASVGAAWRSSTMCRCWHGLAGSHPRTGRIAGHAGRTRAGDSALTPGRCGFDGAGCVRATSRAAAERAGGRPGDVAGRRSSACARRCPAGPARGSRSLS